jgi:hypothetical protein
MGGKASRRKGIDAEREFASLLPDGRRVPLSGVMGGEWSGDVVGLGLRWEVKRRRDAWRELYEWLEGADALALRADRRAWIVVLTLEKFLEVVK